MPYKFQRSALLLIALTALITIPAGVIAQERANFWVAGSLHELDGARQLEKHIETGTGMQVSIVTSHARGDVQYLLLVEAAGSASNRDLQKMNLQYFGVRDPWLITMDLPLKTVDASTDGQAPPSTAQPVPESEELADASKTRVSEAAAPPVTDVEAAGAAAVPVETARAGTKTARGEPMAAPERTEERANRREDSIGTAVSVAPAAIPPGTPAVPQETPPTPASHRTSGGDVNALAAAGLAYYRHERFQAAVDKFSEAIAISPDNEMLYFNRGQSYIWLRQFERAIEDYDRAIELNPSFSWAYNGRGLAHQRLGDREAALRDYKRALELDPANVRAMANRARIFLIQILPVLVILLI